MPYLLFAFIFFSFPLKAIAAGPNWPLADMPRFWILGEGNTHVSLDGFYFHSKENYDTQGHVARPAAMEHIRYGNMRFHIGHGFTPRFSVFAQAEGRGVFAVNADGSNVSDDENYGFGDAFLGGRWLVYRSRATDRIYPTEWAPETWLALLEGTWLFPLYDRARGGTPPLGDQSNDFTAMGRLVWYANEWLGLAANAGYTYRTSGYQALFPWGLRADFNFYHTSRWRFWLDFQNKERISDNETVLNPAQPDPVPGGSLLFKSLAPVTRLATLGLGFRLSKEWELAGAGLITTAGVNTAKGFGGALGLAWRPYQMPELTYEEYRQEQIRRLQKEPRQYRQRPVIRYGFQATIIRVSGPGNYFRIGFGQQDGVKAGDTFQVFPPDDLSGRERHPIAMATVQVSRAQDSFLRVEQRYNTQERIRPGYEVRRVIFSD